MKKDMCFPLVRTTKSTKGNWLWDTPSSQHDFTSFNTSLCYAYCRIALCIDGQRRFTTNKRQLLGKEAIKQRHLKLLGYEVVQVRSSLSVSSFFLMSLMKLLIFCSTYFFEFFQIPYYEFEKLQNKTSVVEYLHQKIFPHSYRLSW